MISLESFRQMALNFDEVDEKPHFDKSSFRTKKKIFATLDIIKMTASLKLTSIDQSVYCQIRPIIFIPASGSWGKQGWTIVDLKKTSKTILLEALKKAYLNVASKENTKNKTVKKIDEQIQTLHPDKNKKNKKISIEKYNFIKANILKILELKNLTHTELMESLYQNIKDSFVGGVQWYGETVKLDLEARKIIERTNSKPEKYKLKATNR